MARIGVSVSPLMMILEETWIHLPNTIFSAVAFIAGLSASFLPETRNIRLPETIEDVEQKRQNETTYVDPSNMKKKYYTFLFTNPLFFCSFFTFRMRSIPTRDEKSAS